MSLSRSTDRRDVIVSPRDQFAGKRRTFAAALREVANPHDEADLSCFVANLDVLSACKRGECNRTFHKYTHKSSLACAAHHSREAGNWSQRILQSKGLPAGLQKKFRGFA